MDTLHTVLRSIRRETKAHTKSNHLDVFREFLDHLDRASKRKPVAPPRVTKAKARKGRK